jgi:hypothetical protein
VLEVNPCDKRVGRLQEVWSGVESLRIIVIFKNNVPKAVENRPAKEVKESPLLLSYLPMP